MQSCVSLRKELSALPVHTSCHERRSFERQVGNIHSYCETYVNREEYGRVIDESLHPPAVKFLRVFFTGIVKV